MRWCNGWDYHRPEYNDIVEDLGNQDQMSLYVDYLFRAGATVVPLRPVGHQPHEVVIDNLGARAGVGFVEWEGAWQDSTYAVYYGNPADSVHYRFASTSASATARARYRPDIPEGGLYPVYA